MKRLAIAAAIALQALGGAAAGHVMLDGSLSGSQVYPGTERTYQVYVPKQYTGSEPACLYVGLDGVLCNAPAVIDSLIAVGKMPVTIAIFLQPGVIKNAQGEVVRYNRSNEFDMTTGTFAHFLESEVLPAVEGRSTPDGRVIHLSRRAQDHAIFGLSSGGIAAFTAAWQRPDLFGRVFSGVGTFVSMRGGNDLQMMVRKSEPKPIKICLQDGTRDAWNPLFGHWYEGNRMLASALDFAGYDTKYDWSDCTHGVKRASEIFADVMTWLWQGWPAPIATGTTQNDLLRPLLDAGSHWQQGKAKGAAARKVEHSATYPDGSLLVEPIAGSNCLQQSVIVNGKKAYTQPFYWLDSYDNAQLQVGGMAYDDKGNLWVVTSAGIQVLDQNGRVRGILNLPRGAGDATQLAITILQDGTVTLTRCGSAPCTWQRHFNVAPATPGQRPKSQGQG